MISKRLTAILLSFSLVTLIPAMHAQTLQTTPNHIELQEKASKEKEEACQSFQERELRKLVEALRNSRVKYEDGRINIYPNLDFRIPAYFLVISLFILLPCLLIPAHSDSDKQIKLIFVAPSVLVALASLSYIIIKQIVLGTKPTVIMGEPGILYQELDFFRKTYSQFLKWPDVDKIETCMKKIRDCFAMSDDFLKLIAENFIAIRGKSYKETLFIPEKRLPISFEEFYDLVIPHLWSPGEKK